MWAQSTQQQFVVSGGKLQISDEQKLILQAAQKSSPTRLQEQCAESIYSQIIAGKNGSYTDAYLQRGVVRREMGDQAGMQSDARAVIITLADASIQQNPNNAISYYQRGMGYRLLKTVRPVQAQGCAAGAEARRQ